MLLGLGLKSLTSQFYQIFAWSKKPKLPKKIFSQIQEITFDINYDKEEYNQTQIVSQNMQKLVYLYFISPRFYDSLIVTPKIITYYRM